MCHMVQFATGLISSTPSRGPICSTCVDWHKVTFFKELLAFGVLTWNELCTTGELPCSYDIVFTFWSTEEPAVLLNREHPAFCKRKFRNWYRMDSSIILDDWAELWEYLVFRGMSRQSFESRFLNHFLEAKKCAKLMSRLGTTLNVLEMVWVLEDCYSWIFCIWGSDLEGLKWGFIH